MGAGTGIAAGAGRPVFDRKRAKSPQFNPVAARQRGNDLIEDRVDDVLDIPLVQMRVVLGDTLNKLGFDHRNWHPGIVRIAISVKMPRTVKTLNQIWTARKHVTNVPIGGCDNTRITGGRPNAPDQQVQFGPAGCHNASMPSRLRRSTAPATPACSI